MAMSQAQAQAWAEGYLQSIGAPATNANDPRVAFLTAQAMHEATNATNNPLAIGWRKDAEWFCRLGLWQC